MIISKIKHINRFDVEWRNLPIINLYIYTQSLIPMFQQKCCVLAFRVSSLEAQQASLPPRGWNSYDAFIWTISEQEFLETADIVSKLLKPHGYEYVVLDYLWYRKNVPGANVDSLGFDLIDEWGRMVPDPDRWPSSTGGKGLTEVAKKVHDMGLKFGIHIMKGLSTQAYTANTPILDVDKGSAFVDQSGKLWRAQDIGFQDRTCKWMPHGFMSINATSDAGKAFLKSLYKDYIDWGVDFIKLDCVFGDDFDKDEIVYVSELLNEVNRPLVFSLSPGANATTAMATEISEVVNMYRITGDDWDDWEDLVSHFDISRDFSAANLIGSKGLRGMSWPDMDMLPLGWLSEPATNEGPHRACRLTFDEQKTQLTLWAMAKSPLMFGGDVRKLDDITYGLITNPTVLEINHYSSNNKEFTDILGLPISTTTNNDSTNTTASNIATAPKAKPIFHLISCQEPKAQGWTTTTDQSQGKICWKGNSGSNFKEDICLYPRRLPLTAMNNEQISAQHYQLSAFNSLASEGIGVCLDARPKRHRASKLSGKNSLSKCREDALQMWELNSSGALVNKYSGHCAAVNLVEGVADGIHSRIATGRKGEIYVAFFNLNSDRTAISTKISDLAKALPGKILNTGLCRGQEVWSGKDFGVLKDSMLIEVEAHGTALLVLNC
ncbi:uncharacterized protein LOC123217298 isoform X2 [Mangifera indica]|uniref:uncharacterized protein LOC123217298 isoform X2 n=1 Tax=Mangifera indica TaxID=29780 RepID=UPI001CF9304E|nr:uncharacterized protein LOC123217298 isoform X2 [Mangifera indica]